MMVVQNYKDAVRGLITAFEEKQNLEFEFFVGDDCSGVASFVDIYYINISDIYYDLDTEQEKGFIIKWLCDCLDKETYINYQSYCMGLRYKN